MTILVKEKIGDDREADHSQQRIPSRNESVLSDSFFKDKKEAPLKKFLAHEQLLCEASPVLNATFKGDFLESGNKTMTIKELDSTCINEFLKWLYCGKRLPEKRNIPEEEQSWYENLVRLALVADVYQVDGLEDDVIDSLIFHTNNANTPEMPVIKLIYENTSEQSQLRRWIVAWYTERVDYRWYCQTTSNLASLPEFASDVAKAFGRQKSTFFSKSLFKMNRKERKAPLQYYRSIQ